VEKITMAVYRIQRLYSSINDKLQRADRNGYMGYVGGYDNGQSRVHQNARKEIIETGKTDGKFAKESANLNTIGGAALGGLAGGLGAAHLKGSNKKLALAAAGGAALGGVASRKLNKSYQKRIAKNRHLDKHQRYVDNIKVADGYMSEEDFDKKWKK
jgi:hypothetical protein